MELGTFASKITDFYKLSAAEQLKYLVYFATTIEEHEWVQPQYIGKLYKNLHIPAYSNIAAYMKKKSKKPAQLFLSDKKRGYSLVAPIKHLIDSEIGNRPTPVISSNLLEPEQFNQTRGYLVLIAKEINLCYDTSTYTACAVLIRRLVETLIIEAYEAKGIEKKIKDQSGEYFRFSELIQCYVQEQTFSPSRILKTNLPKIKHLGDAAAHNRKYIASKNDIDDLKIEIRETIKELLFTIDF